MTVKVAVIYYSATGTVHALARPDAAAIDAARYQGRRLAHITIRLLAGSRVTDPAAGDGDAPVGETTSHTSRAAR
jgi:hypothetical protein